MSISSASRSVSYSSSDEVIGSITGSLEYTVAPGARRQTEHSEKSTKMTTDTTTASITTTTTTSSATATTTTQLVPVMKSRAHLLDECPSDVRQYFCSKYILEEDRAPKRQAVNLRTYARISKSHHAEVIGLLNERPEVGISSTRYALPSLASFQKGEKQRKKRFEAASAEFFQTYRHLYADISTARDFSQGLVYTQGTRKIAINNLLMNVQDGMIVLDISQNTAELTRALYSIPIDMFSGELAPKLTSRSVFKSKEQIRWESELAEMHRLCDHACEALKNFSLRDPKPSVSISLKCVDQPFKTFCAPLVETLATYKEGLGAIKSLDIGLTSALHNFVYLRTASEENTALVNAYANNLSEFIRSNTSLRHLGLRRSGIPTPLLQKVVMALEGSTDLVSLNLADHHLRGVNDDAIPIILLLIDALSGKPSLRFVDLSSCALGESEAYVLLEFLNNHPAVTIRLAANPGIYHSHPIGRHPNARME